MLYHHRECYFREGMRPELKEDGRFSWNKKMQELETSLVVQWLRLHLSVQGVWVWSLVGELRPHMPQGQNNQTIKQKQYCKKKSIKSLIMVHIFKNDLKKWETKQNGSFKNAALFQISETETWSISNGHNFFATPAIERSLTALPLNLGGL